MRSIFALAIIAALSTHLSSAKGESVYVQYRGEVDLSSFDCNDVSRSSFINRVCYDQRNSYMLISLNGKFYHYCEIEGGTVQSLLTAPSMGVFYNSYIKGNYDCRTRRVPEYPAVAAAPATPTKPVCAVEALFRCWSYYSEQEEWEREKRAVLNAELTLREKVHLRNGVLSVDHGIFSTSFPPTSTSPSLTLSVTCSYDDGMEVTFKDNDNSAFVRIGVDDTLCDRIASQVGEIASRLADGE